MILFAILGYLLLYVLVFTDMYPTRIKVLNDVCKFGYDPLNDSFLLKWTLFLLVVMLITLYIKSVLTMFMCSIFAPWCFVLSVPIGYIDWKRNKDS